MLKLLVLFLFLALMFLLAVPIALVYGGLQAQPLVQQTASAQQDDVERIKRIVDEHDPRSMQNGEVRTLTVSHKLKEYLDWPFLEQVFKLERTVTQLKDGVTSTKVIYGFTSLSPDQVTAKQLLHLIRSYWGIENGLHYRRDVTLQEDATRMTNTNLAHAMATINNLVIGLFCQQAQFDFLPSARRFYDANPNEAFDLLTRL